MELIDRVALGVGRCSKDVLPAAYCAGWNGLLNIVNDAPTIDAVPVVRKPVPGYEGYYEVDNLGRVFSVDRIIRVNDNGRIYDKPVPGVLLKQKNHSQG